MGLIRSIIVILILGASNNFTIFEHNILRHKDNCPVNQSDPGSGISVEIQNVVKDC